MSAAYPAAVKVAPDVLRTIHLSTAEEFRRRRTEWGGLLWGKLYASRSGRTVPVIFAATTGQCEATPTSCEILPSSWEAGRRELARRSLSGLVSLGNFHSHPGFGAFLSPIDVTAFWGYGDVAHWLALVVDPSKGQARVWAKSGANSHHEIPLGVIPQTLWDYRWMSEVDAVAPRSPHPMRRVRSVDPAASQAVVAPGPQVTDARPSPRRGGHPDLRHLREVTVVLATVVLLSLGTLLAGVLAERIGSASGDQLLRERTAVLERSALASAGQLSDLRTQISELRQTVGTLEGRLDAVRSSLREPPTDGVANEPPVREGPR